MSSKADAALVGACRRHPLGTAAAADAPAAEAPDAAFSVKTEMASCFNYSQVLFRMPAVMSYARGIWMFGVMPCSVPCFRSSIYIEMLES